MAKIKSSFKCSKCGSISPKWQGQCTQCKEWNTLEEYTETPKTNNRGNVYSNKKSTLLKNVKHNSSDRIVSGINEFDRVVGGGLVTDSITILAAPPGAGKSTLCLMICDKMIGLGKKVLYASGEESSSQIKNRAIRLKLKNIDDLWILDDSNMDIVLNEIDEKDIDFLVLDSIQTYYLNGYLPSRPGNPTQVLECADALRQVCKRGDKPISSIIIGQMTKEDELAGNRALEHLVDTYLRLDGDSDESLRILQSMKNRFGNTGETGFFNMTELGLESIENPSEFFMMSRDKAVVGTSLTVIKEGTRPIIAEIESLVSNSFTPYPSRIGDALRREQLNTLISILEQRANINLYNKNVVIKTSGGIKLIEPSVNLAILMTIASSFYKKEIELGSVFIADVGLTGELKKVPNLESRLKELDRLGYKKVYVAKNTKPKGTKFKNISIIECNTLKEVIDKNFSK